MKSKAITPMGSLHPILFFAVVYVVALLASVFICSSLFYSCNASKTSLSSQEKIKSEKQANPATTVAFQQK
jgi:archaellin